MDYNSVWYSLQNYYTKTKRTLLTFEILSEYEDVLRRPKFKFDERAVRVFLDELKRRAVFLDAGPIGEILPDPKDIVFYAVLMEKRKDEEAYLVTGNLKHFPIRTYIVTPKEMLDIISGFTAKAWRDANPELAKKSTRPDGDPDICKKNNRKTENRPLSYFWLYSFICDLKKSIPPSSSKT